MLRSLALSLSLAVAAPDSVPLYDGLGDHTHRITTSSALAQRYFDQGLALTYGFNHGEAIRSFREAQRLDPSCAMCHWGEALAFGPNINSAMDSVSGAAAYAAVRRAQALAGRAAPEERALIDALARRYAAPGTGNRKALDSAYARAMGEVARRFPASDDAQALYAEALMDLSPWDYWTKAKQPKATTGPMLAALERVLARNPRHAGACHFYIHANEAAHPERAVPCADRLPSLMPGAGHIVHMPAHVYVRVGRYGDAVDINVHATHTDEAHLTDFAPDGAYRLAYYPHNYHFLWFAATMAGRSATALEAARQTAAKVDPQLVRTPGLGALQHYRLTPLFALVRFGKWSEILAEPPRDADLPYERAIWHYARATALAATGRAGEADAELAGLRAARADSAMRGLTIWDLNSASAVLDVALAAATADVAAARGDTVAALEGLRNGVALEDAMTYDEPPTWHLPVRQQLGALLLASGRAKEAERAYREDLERHPDNGWSLHGLSRALRAQGRGTEADVVATRFRKAWGKADVALAEK